MKFLMYMRLKNQLISSFIMENKSFEMCLLSLIIKNLLRDCVHVRDWDAIGSGARIKFKMAPKNPP